MKDEMAEHIIWHSFCHHFKKWYRDGNGDFESKDMIGYEAMTRVESYAKRHPEIEIAYCDDSVFASSMIILIPHPKMGITCIFIPQCTTLQNEWFLYPNHVKYLLESLNKVQASLGECHP